MKTETFPLTITEAGVSAKIRKVTKTRDGTSYDSFVVDYFLLGKRKMVLAFGCYPKVFTYSQPVRVPGAWRDGKLQRLVWLED